MGTAVEVSEGGLTSFVVLAGGRGSAERILWLPPDFRPGHSASNGNMVVIGSGTDRVTFMHRATTRFLPS